MVLEKELVRSTIPSGVIHQEKEHLIGVLNSKRMKPEYQMKERLGDWDASKKCWCFTKRQFVRLLKGGKIENMIRNTPTINIYT